MQSELMATLSGSAQNQVIDMSMHDLKGLQTRQTKIKSTLSLLKQDESDLKRRKNKALQDLQQIESKMHSINKAEPSFTEHGMLRYLERVMMINLADIKNSVLDEKTVKTIKTIGTGKIPQNGYTLVVKNNKIVTIEK